MFIFAHKHKKTIFILAKFSDDIENKLKMKSKSFMTYDMVMLNKSGCGRDGNIWNIIYGLFPAICLSQLAVLPMGNGNT